MQSPIYMFDITPQGRILNLFSKDIAGIDEDLPQSGVAWIYIFFEVQHDVCALTR